MNIPGYPGFSNTGQTRAAFATPVGRVHQRSNGYASATSARPTFQHSNTSLTQRAKGQKKSAAQIVQQHNQAVQHMHRNARMRKLQTQQRHNARMQQFNPTPIQQTRLPYQHQAIPSYSRPTIPSNPQGTHRLQPQTMDLTFSPAMKAVMNIPEVPTEMPQAFHISPEDVEKVSSLRTPTIKPQMTGAEAATNNKINSVDVPKYAPIAPGADPAESAKSFLNKVERSVVFSQNPLDKKANTYVDTVARAVIHQMNEQNGRKPVEEFSDQEIGTLHHNVRNRLKSIAAEQVKLAGYSTPAVKQAIQMVESEYKNNWVGVSHVWDA